MTNVDGISYTARQDLIKLFQKLSTVMEKQDDFFPRKHDLCLTIGELLEHCRFCLEAFQDDQSAVVVSAANAIGRARLRLDGEDILPVEPVEANQDEANGRG